MAPLVSRLADRDLIERQPVDKRSHGLTLTRTGRSLTAKVKTVFGEHEADLLANIPAAQRELFFTVIRLLSGRQSQ
jgi:DNA-binding MarR family transcriptional regulator